MSIKKEDIEYISRLARIELDQDLLDILSRDLSKILDYIDQLKTLDVKDVQPLTHVIDIKNVLREDQVMPSMDKEDILKHAPSRKGDYFKVPKVIE